MASRELAHIIYVVSLTLVYLSEMNNSHRRQNSRGRSTVLKVVILGDGGVGKSCLMNRFVTDRFDEHSFHTIGVEFLNKEIELGGETYTLQIWDTAGQERFKSLRTPFYRGSDMCLLTYAVDDPPSFKNLETWRKEFVYYADVKADFPFLVVGNKIDLERRVTTEEAEAWYGPTLREDRNECLCRTRYNWMEIDTATSVHVHHRPFEVFYEAVV
ncbi:hypothetical protein Pcinc_016169 [Petrolisthes cinctipes]|uniref:Ras-related protein Rab-9A n=1 Tax=Petrolisthes cinctipes TaxID=88211 RepID=A0AAE1KM84_PETCI|nr:hypothetical protein Pcinc_016169 [Petrolisthes cinctipes]